VGLRVGGEPLDDGAAVLHGGHGIRGQLHPSATPGDGDDIGATRRTRPDLDDFDVYVDHVSH